MTDLNSMNCYILTGGKSSRMGTDKASLDFKGKTFAEQISNAIKPYSNSIYNISSRNEHSDSINLIKDIHLDIGPMGGIHSALSHTDKEWNLITSCDLPLLQPKSIYWLLENTEYKHDATILDINNKRNPLFGIYHKSCIRTIESLIAQNAYRMMHLIDNINTKIIKAPDYIADTLININTPEEYQKILA